MPRQYPPRGDASTRPQALQPLLGGAILADYALQAPKSAARMTHVEKEKLKLLNRLKRLRGQVEAIERAVEADTECARVLQLATSCRGALDGFIAEVIEDHILEHLVDPKASRDDPRAQAAEELVEIVHSFLT